MGVRGTASGLRVQCLLWKLPFGPRRCREPLTAPTSSLLSSPSFALGRGSRGSGGSLALALLGLFCCLRPATGRAAGVRWRRGAEGEKPWDSQEQAEMAVPGAPRAGQEAGGGASGERQG